MSRAFWTKADVRDLRRFYPHFDTCVIAEGLGRSVSAVHGMAAKLGVKKSAEFLASPEAGGFQKGSEIGGAHRFAKGHVPANKGLRRPGWISGRMGETQFKKGQKSWRTFPVGHIGPDPEGFLRIKIREPLYPNEPYTKYRPLYAKQVWEQHHGRPVPPRHVFRYRDGNRANCSIENIELVSKREHRIRNSMWAMYPPELAKAIQLNGLLKRKLRAQNAEKE